MSDVVLNKEKYKPKDYVEVSLENITNGDSFVVDGFETSLTIDGGVVVITALADKQLKFKAPAITDGFYDGVVSVHSSTFLFTLQVEAKAPIKEIDNYNSLHFNMFYLYPRSFFTCVTYVFLKNSKEFKTGYPTTYSAMKDRSPSKSDDRATATTEGALQTIVGGDSTLKEQIILDYDGFFTKLSNKFIKDKIIEIFDNMLVTICGIDNGTGLRPINDILDFSEIENDVVYNSSYAKLNYINLYSDQFSGNLKEEISETKKIVFEVNNATGTPNAKYLFDNSIDYTNTPQLKTDYSNKDYDSNNPEEFTFLCDDINIANVNRGYRVAVIGDKNRSEHKTGYAVDTNINFTGSKIDGSKFSYPIKKLLITDYLYGDFDSCRFEINDDSVPHIHIDNTQLTGYKPTSGIALFRGSKLYFMNGGVSGSDMTELDGKLKSIVTDMVEYIYKFSSVDFVNVTFTNSDDETYYEMQKIETSVSGVYKYGFQLSVGDVLSDGRIVQSVGTTTPPDASRVAFYSSSKDKFNEFDQLNEVSFSNGTVGYARKNKDAHSLKQSVEYCSLLINVVIIEYFRNLSYTVQNAYDVAKTKIKINGNFIIVEK